MFPGCIQDPQHPDRVAGHHHDLGIFTAEDALKGGQPVCRFQIPHPRSLKVERFIIRWLVHAALPPEGPVDGDTSPGSASVSSRFLPHLGKPIHETIGHRIVALPEITDNGRGRRK